MTEQLKYEYKVSPEIADEDEMQNMLNEMGAEGWKLHSILGVSPDTPDKWVTVILERRCLETGDE